MWGTSEQNDKKSGSMFEEGSYTFLGKGVDFKGRAKFDGSGSNRRTFLTVKSLRRTPSLLARVGW